MARTDQTYSQPLHVAYRHWGRPGKLVKSDTASWKTGDLPPILWLPGAFPIYLWLFPCAGPVAADAFQGGSG